MDKLGNEKNIQIKSLFKEWFYTALLWFGFNGMSGQMSDLISV